MRLTPDTRSLATPWASEFYKCGGGATVMVRRGGRIAERLASRTKTSRFVGMSVWELVGMALPKSAKGLKTLVGAQGLEPWTR